MNFQRIEILLDERSGWRMILDKDYIAGSAADRFYSYRAGPGKRIDKSRTFDATRKNVEQCLAKTVARGAQHEPFEASQLTAAKCAGYDTHGCPAQISRCERVDSAAATVTAEVLASAANSPSAKIRS